MHVNRFKSQPRFPILASDGTGAAPSYAFANYPNKGFFSNGAAAIGVSFYGSTRVQFYNAGIDILSDTPLFRLGASQDLIATRDAANVWAQRNGVNAQASRLYYSYTDASNYTRLAFKTATGVHTIEAESAGTGEANIDVAIAPKGTGAVRFGTHAGIAAETVTGYITIKDAGGTSRKLAVVS